MKRKPMSLTNRWGKDPDDLVATDCIAGANDAIKAAFKSILDIVPSQLKKADGLTVLNASRILVEIAEAEALIIESGRDSETTGRAMQNPWTVRHQACLGQWLKYSRALGLDPTARKEQFKGNSAGGLTGIGAILRDIHS